MPLAEPLAVTRKLANAPLSRIEGEKPVADPSQGIEAPELTRSLALAAERAHVRSIKTEDADLVVHRVRHEDGLIGAEGDCADPAELVGGLPFRQRFGSNRDDRSQLPPGRCAGVGNVDNASNGIERGGEVGVGGSGVPLIAGGCQGCREEKRNHGGAAGK